MENESGLACIAKTTGLPCRPVSTMLYGGQNDSYDNINSPSPTSYLIFVQDLGEVLSSAFWFFLVNAHLPELLLRKGRGVRVEPQ